MAKITPNESCPCGLAAKFKKCCAPYLEGKAIENAERLLRARYVAMILGDAKFLWDTLHPLSPRRLKDVWRKFEAEQKLLKGLDYKKLTLLDGDESKKDTAVIVHYVSVAEGEMDLSYVEEAKFTVFEGRWHYFDGLRRSSNRIGCNPESVRVGELATFFLHDSGHN